jgi:hypothetical protein
MTELIQQSADNRLGAVYSALYGFWSSRHDAVTAHQQAVTARRDAYSVILFDHAATNILTNDFTSTPDQLLGTVLRYLTAGGTNFMAALEEGQKVMEQNWTAGRFVTFYLAIVQLIDFDISATQSASHDIPV